MTTPAPHPGQGSIDTRAVHAGEPEPRLGGAVVTPIFQTANYLHADTTDYHATRYVRLSNTPNHDVLHAKLAALESAEAALVTSSGMAAISTTLLSVLRTGDHLLIVDAPYGGTRNLVTSELPRLGIETTFIDGGDPATWAASLRPETKAIYLETISNPLMRVPDLAAAARFARERGLVSIVDNTMASPVVARPIEVGIDIVVHSATKYLNGHSDVAAGVIAGPARLVRDIDLRLSHLGGMLDPHACFLLQRGIKTLGLRVRRQCESAMAIAAYLATHPAVAIIHHPSLSSHPDHAHAAATLDGFGGVMSFELTGGVAAAEQMLAGLETIIHAVSLGGVESLAIRPAVTAYAAVPRSTRQDLGVTDGLIRLSVGIEDPADLVADLGRALGRP